MVHITDLNIPALPAAGTLRVKLCTNDPPPILAMVGTGFVLFSLVPKFCSYFVVGEANFLNEDNFCLCCVQTKTKGLRIFKNSKLLLC